MSLYDDVQKEMGIADNLGEFINLKAGSDPIVVKFVKLESAPCTDNEMAKSDYGPGYAYCKPNGKTFAYTFESLVDGATQIMRSHKDAIFFSFKKANVLPGETIKLERTGSGKDDTRYIITKLTQEEANVWVEQRKKDIAEVAEIMAPIEPTKIVNQDEPVKIEDIPF